MSTKVSCSTVCSIQYHHSTDIDYFTKTSGYSVQVSYFIIQNMKNFCSPTVSQSHSVTLSHSVTVPQSHSVTAMELESLASLYSNLMYCNVSSNSPTQAQVQVMIMSLRVKRAILYYITTRL